MNMREILMTANPVSLLSAHAQDGTIAAIDPDLAALRMSIPKGYHHKDVLTHSITVLGNAIAREENGPDLILRTAALIHDIGKPATRKFGARRSVTFDGHEYVGARIAEKMLPRHDYTPEEISSIVTLVENHMRSHAFNEDHNENWTDSGIRRLMTDMKTPEDMDRALIIFYADVTTRHDNKRARIHAAIDRLRENIERVKKEDARKALRPALSGNDLMELYGMKPGPELGKIMKFLNSDDGIHLSRDEAKAYVESTLN